MGNHQNRKLQLERCGKGLPPPKKEKPIRSYFVVTGSARNAEVVEEDLDVSCGVRDG